MDGSPPPLSGRRAQAARNDARILEAARAVFVANPGAPISAVAAHAGVGISALYRRFASKEDLLRELCADGLRRYTAAVETALAEEADPWVTFANFMGAVVEEDTHSLTLRLAGTFAPTEELSRKAEEAQALTEKLFQRTVEASAIRPDVTVSDLSFLFEQLASVRAGDEERTRQLRRRYLSLLLDALRVQSGSQLEDAPPAWEEIRDRWSAPA